MRSFAILLMLLTLAFAAPPSTKPPTEKDKQLVETRGGDKVPGGKPLYAVSHALIIGINKYPNLPPQNQLSYAVRDATALKEALVKNYGFDPGKVILLTDSKATLAAIRDVLSEFADSTKVGKDDRLLIYFSGHGQTVPTPDGGDMGYLIPADAKVDLTNPNNSGPYLSSCMPMRQIWDYLEASPAKHALVIADACFSGLLAKMRGGLSTQAAAVLLARKARMVLTGGSKGEQTSERSDLGHGVFTSKLIDELNSRAATPGKVFTVSDLYSSLQSNVASATNGKQNPQIGSFEADGDVLFVPGGLAPPSTFGDRGPNGAVTLSVLSDPPGAAVWIDDKDTGKVTPCDVPLIFPISAKTAQVRLVMNGFDESIFTVNNTGTNVQLQGKLTANLGGTSTEAKVATAHVKSNPPGASILVDGAATGKVTPADVSVPSTVDGSGNVIVTLHLSGHTEKSFRLHPAHGKSYNVDGVFNSADSIKGPPHAIGELIKFERKLSGARKKMVDEVQGAIAKLDTDFISHRERKGDGTITWRFEGDGTREYIHEFDPMKTWDAQNEVHDYEEAFKSALSDWHLEKRPRPDEDHVEYLHYTRDDYEVRLEATRTMERADLLDRAQGRRGPQPRWAIRLTVTHHVK